MIRETKEPALEGMGRLTCGCKYCNWLAQERQDHHNALVTMGAVREGTCAIPPILSPSGVEPVTGHTRA